jgi:WD40 repeat protein
MPGDPKYTAFISYSHEDKGVARWLHRKLDGYSPPRLPNGPSSETERRSRKSRWRVFLDDEEFAAAGDLTKETQEALAASQNLIVICSPSAVRSDYVNREIRFFKRHAGGGQIFAVIVRGTPHHPADECFPEALTEAVDADGAGPGAEPLAADLQIFRRRQVLYKVRAGILGISYGDFVDRESARRVRRIVWATGMSAGVAIVMVLAVAAAIVQAREAARNLGESLVQRGQRAVAVADVSEAAISFRKALASADSPLARSGLIETLEPPIVFHGEWRVPSAPGARPPRLTSVTFTDDTHVAVGDREGTVRLVDLDAKVAQWETSLRAAVNAVSVSRSRKVVIAGLEDGRVVSLSSDTGAIRSEMKLSSSILSLRHDRDGRQLVVGMRRPGGVVVFDETWKRVFELEHDHAGSVQGSVFNAAGDYFYWGGSGAYIWACTPRDGCQRVTRVEDWVYSIDGSADTRFTAYTAGNKIEFFDHAMEQRQRLAEAAGHIFALRFDPTSRYLVAGGSDRSLSVYDVRAQKSVFTAPAAHRDDIYAVEFSPTAHRLVAVGLDGRVTLWNVMARGAPVPPYGFRPSGAMLAATQRNRISEIRVTRDNVAFVRTWDQRDRFLKIDPAVKEGAAPSEAEFQDRLAASLDLARTSAFRVGEFSQAKLWVAGGGTLPESTPDGPSADPGKVKTTALSRDRRMLAIVRSDGRSDVFDKQDNSRRTFRVTAGSIASSTFLSSADMLLLGHAEGRITGHAVRSGEQTLEVRCGSDEILHLVEIRTSQRFLAVSRLGPMCLFDGSGQRFAQRDRAGGDAVALSPDESMIASAGVTGDILLASTQTLAEIARFDGHRGAVHAVHFTLDSKYLVSGGADETLRVWPAAEARQIAALPIEDLRRVYPSGEPVSRSVALLRRLGLL